MRQALIIIDMQCGSFTSATPRHDADALVVRLNRLAARVREAGGMVVFVQHDGPGGDPHHRDKPGFQLLPNLRVEPGDRRVLKTACDAFLGTSLESELATADIRDLIVTGCATDYRRQEVGSDGVVVLDDLHRSGEGLRLRRGGY